MIVESDNPDFRITRFGINEKGQPYIEVAGRAGGTRPHAHEHGVEVHVHENMGMPHSHPDFELIYAYVIFTDAGAWIINAHGFSHGVRTGDEVWHIEKGVFDSDSNPQLLLQSENAGSFELRDHDAVFKDTGATAVYSAMTMTLEHVGAPDLVARVDYVIDSKYY